MTTDPTAIPGNTADLAPTGRFAAALPSVLLVLLLVTNIPLFLCMPIIDDAALWGLHAQVLLDGGMPYRDIMETNPPGTLWLMAAIRWLLGPSSVALRAADLTIFGLVVSFLLLILKDAGVARTVRTWTGVACLFFYFSISEWCHCQRDMWLIVPSLAWLWLRGRQVQRISAASSSSGRLFGWSILEGLVLGSGIWIKPMVLVPAAAAWLAGACWGRNWRRSLVDASGLVLGGLLMGAGGAIWLYTSGAWPYFWETFLEWNPRYVAAGKEHWTLRRFAGMCLRLFPWLLLHLPALGLAATGLLRGLRSVPKEKSSTPAAATPVPALVMAFYVGWLVQAVALQHLFDYVHAPGVLLAILTCVVVYAWRRSPDLAETADLARRRSPDLAETADRRSPASLRPIVRPGCGVGRPSHNSECGAESPAPSSPCPGRKGRSWIWCKTTSVFEPSSGGRGQGEGRQFRKAGLHPLLWLGLIAFMAVALLFSPAVRWSRLQCWADCLRHGSSAQIRDRLRLMQFPDWQDLERVAAFLRQRSVRDGDVCCFPNSTIHLYQMLGIRPPTRYVYLENTLVFFPERSELLRAALEAAGPKYAVTDLVAAGVGPDALARLRPGAVLSGRPTGEPNTATIFPWGFPIVFHAGRYAVHRSQGPMASLDVRP